MNDEESAAEVIARPDDRAIIEIPAETTEAVLQFIASLEREDADVSGYMISGGGLFGGMSMGNRVSAFPTESGCAKTNNGKDWNCADTDSEASGLT